MKIVFNGSAQNGKVTAKDFLRARRFADILQQLLKGEILGGAVGWERLAEQQGKKLRAVLGEVKDGLIHQVLNDRLAADVHNNSDARPDFGDVSKVLFRADADVCSAGDSQLLELIDDVQIAGFV